MFANVSDSDSESEPLDSEQLDSTSELEELDCDPSAPPAPGTAKPLELLEHATELKPAAELGNEVEEEDVAPASDDEEAWPRLFCTAFAEELDEEEDDLDPPNDDEGATR